MNMHGLAGMSPALNEYASLDAVAEGIVITSTDMDRPGPLIVYVNPAFEAMTGWRADEVIGRSPRFLQGPETDRAALSAMRGPLSRGETWRGCATNYRKDGTPFVMEWSIAPVRGNGGAVTHYIAVQKDVTRRLEDEERLIGALKAAQEADRSKIDFLAMMSHQLRTPLNAIMGYSEMMQSEVLGAFRDSPYASYVDAIHESGGELLRQVEHILAYAQDGEGQEIEEDWVDFSACVAESLSALGKLAGSRAVEIAIEGPGRVMIHGDGQRLRRMIGNLASNAVRYSRPGGAVTVRLEEDDGLTLQVVDQGVGMSREQCDAALQPFQSIVDASVAAEAGGGTGLGLAIAKRAADLHDAGFAIDSRPGCGTTVTVRFPRRRCCPPGPLPTELSTGQF